MLILIFDWKFKGEVLTNAFSDESEFFPELTFHVRFLLCMQNCITKLLSYTKQCCFIFFIFAHSYHEVLFSYIELCNLKL